MTGMRTDVEHRTGGGQAIRTSRRTIIASAGVATLAAAGQAVLSPFGQSAAAQTPEADEGVDLRIYPANGTWTASPHTEISFRGVTRDDLVAVNVTGAISGGHSGILSDHADGNGVSYLPDAHFVPGELVTVRVEGIPGMDELTHRFGVVRPVAWVSTPTERETEDPDVPPREFRSRPDLRPPSPG